MRAFVALSAFALLFLGVYGDSSNWWKTMSLYQIYPRSFKDSDGDGIGDLKGIESKLQHFVDIKVDAFWISPIYPSPMVDFGYDISDFRDIEPIYGTMQDFEDLLKKAHELGLKVIMDMVPNHSSDKHEWFEKSVKKIDPYTDYYVWHPGKIVNGTRQLPNNWKSAFSGPAWSWNEERQEYFLHQFAAGQPDFNYRNEKVVEEIKNIFRFWLDKGVDGFRIDAVPFLYEVADFRDEPLSGLTNDTNKQSYTLKDYTQHLDETYEMVRQWREVTDEYENKGDQRIIMIEAYANITRTIDYYLYKAHFPFNFGLITDVGKNSTAQEFKNVIDNWYHYLPFGDTSNWVAGNHDKRRLASRYGRELAPAVQSIVQLLPGIAVTYYGEEIGMEDTWLSWEETQDPQGCNAGPIDYETESRDPARTPFQWDDSVSAGFSTNPKTWLRVNDDYKENNLAAQKASYRSYYKTFLRITELRKLPVISKGSLQTKLLNNNVFAFSRELEGEQSVYVVINFGYQTETVSLKAFGNVPRRVLLYLNTAESKRVQHGGSVKSDKIRINPRSGAIFVSSN